MARRILIVGNSDGIGAAVTRALLARGDEVIGISRSASPSVCKTIRHEVMNVIDPGYPELLTRLIGEAGPFDACIYCAGIGSNLDLADLSGEPQVFQVNLTAMVQTLELLAPAWLSQRRGHFIGLSSLADILLNPDAPSYSASKAGVSRYLVSMALRLRGTGVAVTNIRFGFVDTKMAKAPYRPMMMTAERAAQHVLDCLDTRPVQVSVPKTITLVVAIARVLQAAKTWLT
jgi:short-subunit dehydrogenase